MSTKPIAKNISTLKHLIAPFMVVITKTPKGISFLETTENIRDKDTSPKL